MPSYDFITGDDFRGVLQADQRELDSALEAHAFKASVVLAGSIVEAMLADVLTDAQYVPKDGKLLGLDLSQLVAAARAEKILTPATADMCSAVRQYRNLIHAGRLIREKAQVNRHNAEMAASVVEIVADELANRKRATYGLTAEQILAKLESDTSALPILTDLLRASNDHERLRLVLKVLPPRYVELDADVWASPDLVRTVSKAYRVILRFVDDDLKKQAAQQFVAVLKAQPRNTVRAYETGLFRASDLSLLDEAEQRTVKQYLMSELAERPTEALLAATDGIGPFLNRQEAISLVQGAMRYAVAADEEELHRRRKYVTSLFEDVYRSTDSEADEGLRAQLDAWIAHFQDTRQLSNLAWARSLRSIVGGPQPVEEMDIDDMPF